MNSRQILVLNIALLLCLAPAAFGATDAAKCVSQSLRSDLQPKPLTAAADEWREIDSMPAGAARTTQAEEFFDRWSKSDPMTLKELTRARFQELSKIKQRHVSEYLDFLDARAIKYGTDLAQELEEMKRAGTSFESALSIASRASAESVLTSHPTQIQSAEYRRLWQLHESLSRSKAYEGLAAVKSELEQVDVGYASRLTVEQEAQETADLFFGNIYEANFKLRANLIGAFQKTYGKSPGYDAIQVKQAAEKQFSLGTWAWDADGKSQVVASTMAASDSIQQSTVYKLHQRKAHEAMSASSGEKQNKIESLRGALAEHSEALKSNPQDVSVVRKYLANHAFPVSEEEMLQSPSTAARKFFSNWAESLSLDELSFGIRSFHVGNQVRQNSAMHKKAVEILLKPSELESDSPSIARVMGDESLRAKVYRRAQESSDPVLRTEIDRLRQLAKDPGPKGTFISADTKTAADVDRALLLMDLTGLTGRARYFPLIENTDTFRELPKLVEQWLSPGSLMRRQILIRSAMTGEPPSLNIMFALSDTNRLGSQSATHLMEMQASAVESNVQKMFKAFPVTQSELESLGRYTHPDAARAPFTSKIYWGGGSQLARGGDWISDEKLIYTVQGNARDLKYGSPEMAFHRMNRQVASAIRHASGKAVPAPSATKMDREALARLISQREASHQELFFDKAGNRDAMEAYLLFGSTLRETRSNSYGARPVSRAEDTAGSRPTVTHRLADRIFDNPAGKSFEQIAQERGLDSVMKMKLKDLWSEMRPGEPYSPPSIDQRTITIDNSFSETRFNYFAKSVESEEAAGIDARTSAKWLTYEDPEFLSYRRQKMGEVLASSLVNLDSHLARLPEALRPFVNETSARNFAAATRGKSASDLTVEDLVSTFAYIHQTVRRAQVRNNQVTRALKTTDNPLTRAKTLASSPLIRDQQSYVNYGQSLLAWTHRKSVFGSSAEAPQGVTNLFPGMESDPLGQLEFLSWALHYEGQQLPPQVSELTRRRR